jgi:hypothetical protein
MVRKSYFRDNGFNPGGNYQNRLDRANARIQYNEGPDAEDIKMAKRENSFGGLMRPRVRKIDRTPVHRKSDDEFDEEMRENRNYRKQKTTRSKKPITKKPVRKIVVKKKVLRRMK